MMSAPLLIASEFRLNRETLLWSLQTLRPDMKMCAVEPGDVDNTVNRIRPWLVICSNVTAVIEELAPAWIVLHPDDAPYTTVCALGERYTIPNSSATMGELLAIIDKAWADHLEKVPK